ncbi:hypothetical protein GE21DRAFT_1049801 [Neurospora crassa]|nr:hypothetical protein GE21DRAFT_1049801 [Neurospora crassa]
MTSLPQLHSTSRQTIVCVMLVDCQATAGLEQMQAAPTHHNHRTPLPLHNIGSLRFVPAPPSTLVPHSLSFSALCCLKVLVWTFAG